MPRLTRGGRLRRFIRISAADNARENDRGTLASIERDLRARLSVEDPAATVEEIEERVAAAIRRGMRPSTPPPPDRARPPRRRGGPLRAASHPRSSPWRAPRP